MLGQRLRHWRSTEAAGYKIAPARNIIIYIYEPEPAVSITQKYFMRFFDISKSERVCQRILQNALYKIIPAVSITQKYFMRFFDISKSERVCQRILQNALYKIIHIVKPS